MGTRQLRSTSLRRDREQCKHRRRYVAFLSAWYTGQRPYGWLSRYLTTEHTARLLAEAGFEYHMDDYSDDQPFWQSAGGRNILVLPYALDSNDMKLWTAPG